MAGTNYFMDIHLSIDLNARVFQYLAGKTIRRCMKVHNSDANARISRMYDRVRHLHCTTRAARLSTVQTGVIRNYAQMIFLREPSGCARIFRRPMASKAPVRRVADQEGIARHLKRISSPPAKRYTPERLRRISLLPGEDQPRLRARKHV